MIKRMLIARVAVSGLPLVIAGSWPRALAGHGPVPVAPAVQSSATAAAPQRALIEQYCAGCHNERTKSGNLVLTSLDVSRPGDHPDVWEKVVRKLRAGLMPPAGRPRPDQAAYDGFRSGLEGELDRAAAAHPNPGRTETFHRLNRVEYQNAIRDVLALDIDAGEFLPADDSSYGFDNMAGVLRVAPAQMERYLAAANTISRMAMGAAPPAVDSKTFRMAPDGAQSERGDGLPPGTRGGTLIQYVFPQDGRYTIKADVSGTNRFGESEKLEFSVDDQQVHVAAVGSRTANTAGGLAVQLGDKDNRVEAQVPIKAGPHAIGVAFYRKAPEIPEQTREPFFNPGVSGNDGGISGPQLYVMAVTIAGPYAPAGPGDTPSRRRVLACQPTSESGEGPCAQRILAKLAHHAYRGMELEDDVQVLVDFYNEARSTGATFEGGIEFAIARMLVDPLFLFRTEGDHVRAGPAALRSTSSASSASSTSSAPPADSAAVTSFRVSDLELASRLSFFIWSSVPDEELLNVARAGRLKAPEVLEAQVRRMLADPRCSALTENFAAQWLLLRNVATVRPGEPYLLAFDETLRVALRRETELLLDSILRENRSAMEILTARYTFLNERLARHYGIPNIQGSHFRRVELPEDSPRRGILGHGSILTLTSHAIRTSPVIRGKWILNNILGTPPPDPPPNVPALQDQKTQARVRSLRERMSQHRANPVCSACHSMIDPAGFALENFDAIGRWRTVDESYNPIDAAAVLPDGTQIDGVAGLRGALARRPDRFVNTLTEKMLTYALGRGLDYYDMPAVRRIVNDAARDDYRMQTIVMGIVKSYPFLNRRTGAAPPG
ncbi:MAG TPA: DUF1592 domain-containing protein [Vicinamibacterales bacterium]|nr:DUF1592 domain-containing protein [Vicinamibacterales bacterium]